ncbi:MAG TPA: hypothetical protein VGS58_06565, partial [Candidatus Sulfopaludibacter sp.]|nr:hypothetical protein [Candidatus Sulfopaludibacter sp.]
LSATFDMTSQVLNAVEIVQGQFITLTAQSTQTDVQSQFVFWGLMDFQSLKGFDAFSFGRESGSSTPAGLNFAKLAVQMSYNPQNQSPPAFVFDASQISFDMAASTARAASFYSHFPISLASFTQAPAGVTPAGQGFMSVQTPLNQSLLSFPWFSLNFNLNLGTTGALAAQAGFVATVTIGWGPNQRDYMVFTGLKLPGSNGPKRAITIEGIFDIGFKTLEIVSIPSTSTYILVLYGINFEFLSFQFPPNGQVNFVLFGNPGQSKGTNLGWYAAYAKTGSGGGGGDGGGDKNLLAAAQLRRLTSAIPGGVR